ncbi:hypothetical protein [Nostoc sp. TCL26-01]|uniref:hypothetical protein n=1 Tax=Nostoc sp. TCL26-01 TaxID=2576904 RepID=UPI0015B87CB2|nr:hypothetical protein [Nostoc sp. TCL26-01]
MAELPYFQLKCFRNKSERSATLGGYAIVSSLHHHKSDRKILLKMPNYFLILVN